MIKAKIKAGQDNRQTPGSGAAIKWEDIVGIRPGTIVDVLSRCHKTSIAVVRFISATHSSCGKKRYDAGAKRMVPLAALEECIDLDTIAGSIAPWKAGLSANDTWGHA